MKLIIKVPSVYNAYYAEDSYQQRMATLYLIGQAQLKGSNKQMQRFTTSLDEFKNVLGLTNISHLMIKTLLDSLTNIKHTFNMLSKDPSVSCDEEIPIIDTAVIRDDRQIEFSFHPKVYDWFINPDKHMYTNINLKTLLPLKFASADLMYRLVADYLHIRQTPMIPIKIFRLLVRGHKHHKFNNFKARLLMPMLERVNSTDIHINEPIYQKGIIKNSYTYIKFTMSPKTSTNPTTSAKEFIRSHHEEN